MAPGPEERGEAPAGKPVPPGMIRLKGHFAGYVVTASHCLDINVPLQYEVPLEALEPAVLAFLEAQKEAEALSPGGDFVAESTQMESSVWKDLLTLVAADKGKDSRAREIMKIAQQGKRGRVAAGDPQLQSIQEQGASALEVDLEAKEELLEQVMKERERLREQNEVLKEQQEKEEHRGGITGFIKKATKIADGVEHFISEGVQEVEHALGLEGDAPDKDDSQALAQDQADDAGAADDGSVKVSGHFAGSITTRSHHLEVAIPVEGPVPGAPLIEIASALAGEPGADGKRQVRVGASKESAVDPKVWRRLLALLRSHVPPERVARAQTGPMPAAAPVSDGTAEAALQQELQQLRRELKKQAQELETALSSHNRLQVEADGLRARNTALAGYLASAETNAQKLRSTLSHVSAAPALSQDGHRHRAGAVARTALAEADKQASRTALRPQAPRPLDVPGQADPAAAPPPPTSTSSPESAAFAKTFAQSTISPLNATRGFCAGERQPAALFRSPPCSTTTTPRRSVTPPAGRTTPRLKLTDAALVADLRELERWAKELRSLKGP